MGASEQPDYQEARGAEPADNPNLDRSRSPRLRERPARPAAARPGVAEGVAKLAMPRPAAMPKQAAMPNWPQCAGRHIERHGPNLGRPGSRPDGGERRYRQQDDGPSPIGLGDHVPDFLKRPVKLSTE